MPDKEYELEDIRSFVAKRDWLRSERYNGSIITEQEWSKLKDRLDPGISAGRAHDIRWFIKGYLSAKN
jgi:hypothetical protein